MSAVGGRNTRMSPPLVGSITVLIVVITTFLAYNSNKGLPWVPSQILTVEVKNAANIVPGNEVRIGGTRVGIVSDERAKQYPDGRVTALLDLKLDQNAQRIPVDSSILIRARSLLGLKYVQITPGASDKDFEWGTTVPLENANPDPVEIDQLFNTFDEPTRVGITQTITEFGNALGGRGSVIGKLLDEAGPLTDDLVPVAEILADQDNGMVPFLRALGRFTGELAAAGEATGGLFRNLDRTTGALANADQSLDATLRVAPDALSSTAASLARTRSAIGPHIEFARALQPAIDATADGAASLAAASQAGVAGLGGVPRTARDFIGVLDQLDRIGTSSVVARGLDGLTQFSASSQPLVEGLSRAQTVCSYPSLLFRNIASATFDGDSVGNFVRVVPYIPPFVPNGEGVPATSALNGATASEGVLADATRKNDLVANAFLYTNPQPVTGAGGVCEPGYETRESYATAKTKPQSQNIGNPTLTGKKPFRPAPPLGSEFRPAELDAPAEDEDDS